MRSVEAARSSGTEIATAAFSGVPVPAPDGAGPFLSDCVPLRGEAIEQSVSWNSGADVTALAGAPVRLRVALHSADLFSFQFRQ